MKAVIFDMDGVIVDSEPLHFQVDMKILGALGVPVTQAYFEKFVGMTNPEMWEKVIREFRLTATVDELVGRQMGAKLQYVAETDLEPIIGVSGLVDRLRRAGLLLAIASSSPRLFIEAVVSKFRMTEVFKVIVSSEEVPRGKPAPDVYLEVARRLSVLPDECAVIEDAYHGVVAAKRAGMTCIGYRNLNSGKQDLSAADCIVDSILEIKESWLVESHPWSPCS